MNKLELKQILDEDKNLEGLAKIPFWLNIMTDAGKSLPREGSSKELQNKLFEEYIIQRFEESGRPQKYKMAPTIKWLTWLASKLTFEGKTVFLVEEMQPSWLEKEQKNLYLKVLLCIGMLLGLLFGIPYGLILRFYISYSWELSPSFLSEGMALGIAGGAIIGTAAQYFLKIHRRDIRTHKIIFLSAQKIMNISFEFLKESVEEAIKIGILVLLFCLFFLPILNHFFQHGGLPIAALLLIGLLVPFFFGVVTLIIRLLSNGFVEKEEVRTVSPNQGILDSRKRAYLVGQITTALVAIINTLLILIVHGTQGSLHHLDLKQLFVTLILGLCAAFVTGAVAVFIHDSGRVCQQHFALRIVLRNTGCIPWDYVDFLDYASEPNKLPFLNRIGGGYYFFNGILKEYIAFRKEKAF